MKQVPQPNQPDWQGRVTALLQDIVREMERSGPLVVRLRGPADVLQVYVGAELVGKVVWDGSALVLQ